MSVPYRSFLMDWNSEVRASDEEEEKSLLLSSLLLLCGFSSLSSSFVSDDELFKAVGHRINDVRLMQGIVGEDTFLLPLRAA